MTRAAREREAKAERLEVRLTPATKALLGHAAHLKHTTLTDFLISSAVRAAEDALVSPRVFEVDSEEGWNTLMGLLDAPSSSEPDDRLVSLLRSTRKD
ncbi:MAG TPA: DUF1778 domain-containing protein [Acetobacteraceae bacterium]|nr:DUF1778 domain-containing protein [Acetobacteraceae bacterium]